MVESFLKYLQFEKRLSINTITSYETDLMQFQNFIATAFPDYSTESADFGIIRAWIISLVEASLDSSSVNRKIACLRSYFKFLMRQGIVSKDPLMKVKILKSRKKLPSFVKESEILSALEGDYKAGWEGLRDQLVMELFYGTGIRLSELIHLKEINIDHRDQTIRVIGKRNKERVVPFNKSLGVLIKTYQHERNREVERGDHGCLLVTANGDPCYPMLIYRLVRNRLKETSAERKSPHVLRHTYATHLLDKGAEINAVKDLLGHTSLAATQVYTHNSIEKLKKAFDQAHPKA